ncbi:putative C69 family dipeptidase [Blattamonas nauphoetae]|uniref:C69 family dipeptidase n=1 Tax=Blattamonas nauphoetae TaxID=2049346 RepID=A0ABQ9XMW6_9EUKA|nr:putative C69 family dipeptidase [Blattamonas nauphoetae]
MILFILTPFLYPCTNLIVTKGASKEGYNTISYAADSFGIYGVMKIQDAADHPAGTMRQIHDWDSGKYLGEIPEVAHTFQVTGNMNEKGLVIGETTWTGKERCKNENGIMDYGSLIYTALSRCSTAREAWETMVKLTDDYGYASTGETFTIADKDEIWLLDMIGRGNKVDGKGTLWIAMLVPDGTVSVHANFPRTQNLAELKKLTEVHHSPDLLERSKELNLIHESVTLDTFDWSVATNGINPPNMRYGDGRVVSFFAEVVDHKDLEDDMYKDYLLGDYTKPRPKQFYKPKEKVSLETVMKMMGNHHEDISIHFANDVGAGPYHAPYRNRPLTWTSTNGEKRLNERSIGTPQTGWLFVSQCRPDLPEGLGGMFWFGVDDGATTVYVPHFSAVRRVHDTYVQNDDHNIYKFSFNSLFWVHNLVSNLCYSNYINIYPEVQARMNQQHKFFKNELRKAEKVAISLAHRDVTVAQEYVTNVCMQWADKQLNDWNDFFKYLFLRYNDQTRKLVPTGQINPIVEFLPYQNNWYKRITEDHGDLYEIPEANSMGKEDWDYLKNV